MLLQHQAERIRISCYEKQAGQQLEELLLLLLLNEAQIICHSFLNATDWRCAPMCAVLLSAAGQLRAAHLDVCCAHLIRLWLCHGHGKLHSRRAAEVLQVTAQQRSKAALTRQLLLHT
jgi:hypothetical protein